MGRRGCTAGASAALFDDALRRPYREHDEEKEHRLPRDAFHPLPAREMALEKAAQNVTRTLGLVNQVIPAWSQFGDYRLGLPFWNGANLEHLPFFRTVDVGVAQSER